MADDYPDAARFGADEKALKKYLRGTPPRTAGNGREADVRKGFVCKRVLHITLESIANNPDI